MGPMAQMAANTAVIILVTQAAHPAHQLPIPEAAVARPEMDVTPRLAIILINLAVTQVPQTGAVFTALVMVTVVPMGL